MSIIPSASPTGQMGGGQFSPAWKELQPVMVVGAQVGFTVVSLVGVGKILKAGRVISAADALLVRLYQSGKLPLIGGSTYYPPGWIGPGFTIAAGTISTWFTPDSSGGGGPGELPASTTPPPSIEEYGDVISGVVPTGPSFAQVGKPGGPASSAKRRSRPRRGCPVGYIWSKKLRKCVFDEEAALRTFSIRELRALR